MSDAFEGTRGVKGALRLAPHLRPVLAGPGRVVLQGERGEHLLSGRAYAALVPLLDGTRTVEALMEALAGAVPMAELHYALGLMEERGYLVSTPVAARPEEAAFWSALGVTDHGARPRRVALEALGDEDPGALREALSEAGVVVTPEADLRIVLTGDYLADELRVFNRRALEDGLRWIPVKLSGTTPWLGPVFQPGRACWECLAERLWRHRPITAYLRRRGHPEIAAAPRAALGASVRAASGLAAVVLARWLVTGKGEVDEHLVALDLTQAAIERHGVMRRPQCPACGDPGLFARWAMQPPVLESHPRPPGLESGYRTVHPEETFSRYQHLVSPVTGVLASLEPSARRHRPPRFALGAFYPVLPSREAIALADFYRIAGGKGCTAAQARTSALCEGLERVSGLYQGDEPRLRASLAELGAEGVHPRDLLLFSEAQYHARDAWNAAHARRWQIPLPFDEQRTVDWTPAWSLTHQRWRYLPMTYCFQEVPVPSNERFCEFDTNGQAAGNCLEEAILHGLLELVERDAVAIWWYNRLPRPAVELKGFGDRYLDQLEALYSSEGRRLRVLDLTSDLSLPVFAALIDTTDGKGVYAGFGCHLDPHMAVLRAIAELNQVADPGEQSPAPWSVGGTEEGGYLHADPTQAPRLLVESPKHGGRGDLAEDVRFCVERMAQAGLEVLIVRQTRPDLGLPVVKVVVPGLRHFWPRFGPGRLYDVPVRMGWLKHPLAETALNPHSILA